MVRRQKMDRQIADEYRSKDVRYFVNTSCL